MDVTISRADPRPRLADALFRDVRAAYRWRVHDPEAGLFGREPQLARLQDAVERAAGGQPAFLLVTGEAGIGKTRLLRAVAARAAGAGLRTLWGTAIESGRGVPYLPLLAPLRVLADEAAHSRDRRAPAADEALAVIRRALRVDAAGPTSEGAVLEAARLVEAVFDVLARRPTLLVVDDVHWADDSTLTVLDYLAHRAVDVPLVVVAAARDEEPATLARLPIADGRRFARLAIGRLSAGDVRRQAAAILGSAVPVARAGALHRRTAGNPFFVEQLLAQDRLDDGPATGSPPTASLHALVLRRIVGLSDDARRAVEALAVIGHATGIGHVARIAGLEDERARRGLDAATAAGMTVTDNVGVAFRHPLFAEVIEAELSGPERRALHAAAAGDAEATAADAAEVADHWWQAGDRRRAWSSALAAATAAGRSYAFAEAGLHLDRALAAWPEGHPGRVEALLEAGRAAWLTADPERAMALAQEARTLEPESVESVVALGTYAWDAGRRAEAVEAFTSAGPMLGPDASPAVRARATWGSGRASVATGDAASGVAAGLDAARQAIAIGDLVVASEGYALAGMSRAFQGSLDGAPWLDEAVRLALESGATFCTGHGFQFLVDLRGLEGSADIALDAALRGIDACSRLGLSRTHGSDLRGRAALLLIDAGRLDEAEAILDEADPRAFPALATARVAIRRGEFDRAEAALDEAAVTGAIGGPGSLGGWLELARVELAWLRSDRDAARGWVESIPFVPGVWGADVGAWAARWRARLGVGDAPALSAAAAGHPDPALRAALGAEVRAATTEPADAPAWRAAAEAWRASGRRWEEAWARLAEATASFAARDTAAGREALELVLGTADALRSDPLRAHAAELARRARLRLGRPTRVPAFPDAPTGRELEVLELLAEGLTNPQIAERLFLSPKTVGIHVSRLLGKLASHTRGEAVAVARRRGLIG